MSVGVIGGATDAGLSLYVEVGGLSRASKALGSIKEGVGKGAHKHISVGLILLSLLV